MKKIINWLVTSSADPTKVSLTVRGALIGIIPILLSYAQIAGMHWSQEELTQNIETITTIVSTFFILLGLIRKLFYSIKSLKR